MGECEDCGRPLPTDLRFVCDVCAQSGDRVTISQGCRRRMRQRRMSPATSLRAQAASFWITARGPRR